MTPQPRPTRVFELFEAAKAQPAAERQAFLGQACQGDAGLLAEVQALLAMDAQLDAAVLPATTPPELWLSLEKVFRETLSRPAGDRLAYLDSACPDEPQRQLLQSMLGYQRAADGSLAATPASLYLDPNGVSPWPEGHQVGSYRVLTRIAHDWSGQSFEAEDIDKIGVAVRLKSVRPEFIARLRDQSRSQVVAGLNHPHICGVLEAGQDNGVDFLVMHFVPGATLEKRLTSGPLPLEQCLQLALDLCDTLEYTHEHGLVHRDLHPGNIVISKSGIQLLDFGVPLTPRPESAHAERTLTALGVILGKAAGMSPEQVLGHPVDVRSGIFSLGLILYRMACAEQPFQGASLYDLLVALLTEPPRPMGNLSSPLQQIILRCLAKQPEERFPDVPTLRSALRAATTFKPATYIGPYKIVSELGRGGMGIVYRAEDQAIRREVAIKVIQLRLSEDPAEQDELRERFLREARAAGSLSHPGIVTVHHLGEHEGEPYIVMELIEGGSLQRYLRPAVRTPADQRKLRESLVNGLRSVADALDYAHRHSVIHRDIKPANIFVSKEGVFKVGDFGIAKVLKETSSSNTGLIGSPLYIAPEQLRGAPASTKSDQFALGVTAYQVVTGQNPYPGKTEGELFFQIVSATPTPASSLVPELDPSVDLILQRVLSKEPAQRFKDCREFANALYHAVKLPAPAAKPASPPEPPPVEPPPPPPVEPPPPPVRPPGFASMDDAPKTFHFIPGKADRLILALVGILVLVIGATQWPHLFPGRTSSAPSAAPSAGNPGGSASNPAAGSAPSLPEQEKPSAVQVTVRPETKAHNDAGAHPDPVSRTEPDGGRDTTLPARKTGLPAFAGPTIVKSVLGGQRAGDPVSGGPGTPDPSHFEWQTSLLNFIAFAYRVEPNQVNGPDWLDTQVYNIYAPPPEGVTEAQFKLMLQNLLAHRFRMTVHRQTVSDWYDLVVADGGSKMKQEAPGRASYGKAQMGGQLSYDNTPMSAFTKDLAGLLGFEMSLPKIRIQDKTGLTGRYTFRLEYAQRHDPGPDIFHALESQLGLKLQPQATRELVVVDRADEVPVEK